MSAVILAAVLAGCQPKAPSVDAAWVRLAAVPGRPAAAYFTLHGGARDATLVAVRTPAAARSEMHESMGVGGPGGTMSMTPLSTLAVPAGGTVAFAPGGRHVMLFGVGQGMKAGGTTTLDFAFADGARIQHAVRVVGAADPAP